jgi:cellobiose phosphorylase
VQVRAEIAPGASFRADFFIGPTSGPEHARELLAGLDAGAVDAALAGQIEIERERALKFRIDTGNADLDALVNDFSKKQMVSYLIDKSGFRDNLQNDMGLAMCDYPVVRANLLRALASQKADGDVPHGFRPLNPLPYADKPCWALHCVPWILKESGDMALLDVEVPYFRGEDRGTVWDHLLRAMRFLAGKTGAHGLCDQRFADWDDELEPSEKTGARESVMVTQQFCLGLLEMAELADLRGEGAVAAEARGLHAQFAKRLNEVAWDGEWFQRTLCEGGYTAGSRGNEEGKIYLYCQSWAVLSQSAPEERLRQCMAAADRMCEDEIGWSIVMPPYSKFDDRLGKASSNRPYSGTNGGAYCHAAGFHAVAHAMLGNCEEAWRVIRKVAPGSPWNPLSRSRAEPFSWTNCYEKAPERYGQACLPWRTGTASWFCMAIVEWILGARRNYGGLLIDPCLPREIRSAHVTRSFRGATFEIEIDNGEGRGRGVRSVTLDGQRLSSPVLPDLREGTHQVEVHI